MNRAPTIFDIHPLVFFVGAQFIAPDNGDVSTEFPSCTIIQTKQGRSRTTPTKIVTACRRGEAYFDKLSTSASPSCISWMNYPRAIKGKNKKGDACVAPKIALISLMGN